jgi:hypothetical protein
LGRDTLQAIRGEETPVSVRLDVRPRADDDLPPGNASPQSS